MIKIKLTAFGAHIPKKATDGAAAYDLYVPDYTIITPGRNILNLGFQIELNPHTQATVDPRSGYSSKGMEGYDKTMYVDGEIVPVSIFSKWFAFSNGWRQRPGEEMQTLSPERLTKTTEATAESSSRATRKSRSSLHQEHASPSLPSPR